MKELIDPGPSEAGWHRLQTVLQCPRKYALGYLEEKPREVSDALVKGSLIHVGLAHFYMRQVKPEYRKRYYTPEEAVAKLAEREEENSPLWREHVAISQHVVEEYIKHWRGENLRPLWIEEQFRGYVRDGQERYLYTQRADLIAKDPAGRVWILDHKTTFRISAKTIQRYALSGQFLVPSTGQEALWEKFYELS